MKKEIKILFLTLCMIMGLVACGNTDNYELSIEKHNWKISSVQNTESGEVIISQCKCI